MERTEIREGGCGRYTALIKQAIPEVVEDQERPRANGC
jgi:hypothetical protein